VKRTSGRPKQDLAVEADVIRDGRHLVAEAVIFFDQRKLVGKRIERLQIGDRGSTRRPRSVVWFQASS
jgi:hypothetical protein